MGLQDGQKSLKIGLAVQTQYWRVTEGQTPHDGNTALCRASRGKNRKQQYSSVIK